MNVRARQSRNLISCKKPSHGAKENEHNARTVHKASNRVFVYVSFSNLNNNNNNNNNNNDNVNNFNIANNNNANNNQNTLNVRKRRETSRAGTGRSITAVKRFKGPR